MDKRIIEGTIARIDFLDRRIETLEKALAFAASCIKSGERWSATCDEIIGSALASTEAK